MYRINFAEKRGRGGNRNCKARSKRAKKKRVAQQYKGQWKNVPESVFKHGGRDDEKRISRNKNSK